MCLFIRLIGFSLFLSVLTFSRINVFNLLVFMIEDEKVTLYGQGEFVDLCRGPHLESTGKVSFFRLLSLAGAYWRGKEGNPMLKPALFES